MQWSTLPAKKIAILVVGLEGLLTTVKLDNTLTYEWLTDIYHAAVPCSGMKKGLRLHFAAVTLLIISTGMAQTETLPKWLPHRKKAARQTELRSWNCALGDAIITRRRKSFIQHSVFILLFVIVFLQDSQREKEGERERYCQEAESTRHG
jgi:hypothetical protein